MDEFLSSAQKHNGQKLEHNRPGPIHHVAIPTCHFLVISQIESIRGGRAGGDGVGVGSRKWVIKQPFKLKQQCCAFSM